MSIAKFKILSIIGINNKLDDVLKICGESEAFQPEDALSFYSNTSKFKPLISINPFNDSINKLQEVLSITQKSLNNLDKINNDIDKDIMFKYVDEISSKVKTLFNKKNNLIEEVNTCIKNYNEVSHFIGLNLDFNKIINCKCIKIRFGRLPKESINKLHSYEDNPYVLFFPCTSDETHQWGVYFTPIENSDEVDKIFSSLYFERLRIYDIDSTPENKLKQLEIKIKNLNSEISDINKQIESIWENEKNTIQKYYSKLSEYKIYYDIRKYGALYGQSFIIVGWIPDDKQNIFKNQLDKIEGIEYSIDDVENVKQNSPPILLKNKKLFKPFEFFIDMYGFPNYKEIDPTPFVSITYFLLFGIMFGDFGHGLLLELAGFFMWHFKQMKLGKVLIPCGISSMFFGVLYGSCFGFENAFDWLYKEIFNLNQKPISVMDSESINLILYCSVGIGILLIILSMISNVVSSFKQKDFGNAIFSANGICGIIFYTSLVLGIVSTFILNKNIMTPLYILILFGVPLILIMFNEVLGKLLFGNKNWKPENFADYTIQSIFELLEVLLSYATNTISFLRVGAYVLVHAGMLLVVFTLAEMSGGIGYIIVLIIGNLFVAALEGLLVGIQVLRLEFYEMFSRFYKGDGIPFKPIVLKKS